MLIDAKTLQVKVLGYPEVLWDNTRLKLPTQKLQAILYFLAMNGQVSREELAELLWESDARHRLRPELHRLKKLEGAASWLTLDDTVKVDFDTDVTRFEQYVREENFAKALELHPEKAYLLQGFNVEDAPQFMDWLSLERDRIAGLYHAALRGRAEELSTRQVTEALHLARLMIQLDPLDEGAYRLAMRLEYARGHIQAALKQFETCRRVLAEELDIEPLEETLSLAQEIEKGKALPVFAINEQKRLPQQLLRPPSLIARETEWARMEAAYNAGQAIFISGLAGVGKTRLMLDFASSKGDVVMGEGRIGDENIPLSSQARLFAHYLEMYPDRPLEPWIMQELSRFLFRGYDEPLPTIPNEEDKPLLYQAVVAFFNHAAEHLSVFPTDNLHYFDSLSAEVSNRAAATFFSQSVTTSTRRCAINTFRLDEMPPHFQPMLEQFKAQGLGIHIELEPLSLEAVKHLILSLELDNNDKLAEKLYQLTAGNPQFVIETLKSLYATGQLDNVPEKIALPERLGYVLNKRLDNLSTFALRIAKAVATLELKLSNERLADVLELNAFDIAEGMAELEEAQVFSGNQFVHDLLQETAKKLTPAAVQRHLHKRVAMLLERDKPIAARIAHHYLAADERENALPWRLKATQEAIDNGFLSEASGWLEELLFEAPEESKTYMQALVLKGKILLQQDIQKAESCFKESLELSHYLHSDVEVEALAGLAECARAKRDFAAATMWLNKVFALPLEPHQKAHLHHLQGIVYTFSAKPAEAEAAFEQAVQGAPENFEYQFEFATFCLHQGRLEDNLNRLLGLLRRYPEKAKTTLLYHHLGIAFWVMGKAKEALPWMQKSLELWQGSGHVQYEARSHLELGTIHLSLGQYKKALEAFEEAEKLFLQIGFDGRAADAQYSIGYAYYLGHQFEKALSYFQSTLPVLKEQSEPILMSLPLSFLALTQIKLNDLQAAQATVKEAVDVAEFSKNPFNLLSSLPTEAMLVFHMGNVAKAKQLNQRIIEIAKKINTQENLARALIFKTSLTEEPTEAASLAKQAYDLAEQNSLAHLAFEAASLLCQAGLSDTYEEKRLHWLAYLEKNAPENWSFR